MGRQGTRVLFLLLLDFVQISSPQVQSDVNFSRRAPPFPVSWTGAAGCEAYHLEHGRTWPMGAVRHLSIVGLSCDPGYELSGPGDASVQCLLDGSFTWGKTCKPISCGKLAEPGSIAEPPGEIFYPNAAKLTCGRGYMISYSDSTERRCLSNGRFSEGATCKPVEQWSSADVQHARADLLMELELLITGKDFVIGAFYECHLTNTKRSGACTRSSTEAVALSPNLLRCLKPRQHFTGGRYELSISKSGLQIPYTSESPHLIFVSPVVLRAHPSTLPAIAGVKLMLFGEGFDLEGRYRCVFRDRIGSEAESASTEVFNTTTIGCILPEWDNGPRQVSVAVVASARGHVLSSAEGHDDADMDLEIPPFPDGDDHPHRLKIDFVEGWSAFQPVVVPSAGGSVLTIHGFGFQLEQEYYLRVGKTDYSQEIQETRECACIATSSRDLQCRLPCWSADGHGTNMHLFRRADNVEIQGSAESIRLTFSLSVESVVPTIGPLVGGFVITVRGSGFSSATEYTLKIHCDNGVSRSGSTTSASQGMIVFKMPTWQSWPCDAQVSVGAGASEIYWHALFRITPLWERVAPNRVPCCLGRTQLRILGRGFSQEFEYTCIFQADGMSDEKSIGILDISRCKGLRCTVLICDTPAIDKPMNAFLDVFQNGEKLSSASDSARRIEFSAEGWAHREPISQQVNAEGMLKLDFSHLLATSTPFHLRLLHPSTRNMIESPCSAGSSYLMCQMPCWSTEAGSVDVYILQGSVPIPRGGSVAPLVLKEYWTGMSTERVGFGIRTQIVISGHGFSSRFRYRCLWTPAMRSVANEYEGSASIEPDGSLSCTVFTHVEVGLWSLSLSKDGETLLFGCPDSACSCAPATNPSPTLHVVPVWMHSNTTWAKSDEGFYIAILGTGISPDGPEITCQLQSVRTSLLRITSRASSTGLVRGQRSVTCSMPPVHTSGVSVFMLSVSVGDVLLVRQDSSPWYFSISDLQAHHGYVESFTASGPSTGGTSVTLTGFGFNPDYQYTCDFGGALSTAVFVSSLELSCRLPTGPGAEDTVSFALACGEYEVKLSPSLMPAKFTYLSQWSLDRDYNCSISGEGVIAVRGAGFDLAAEYQLIFVGVDRAGRSVQQKSILSYPSAHDQIVFACPPWKGYEQKVQLKLLKGHLFEVTPSPSGVHHLQYHGHLISIEKVQPRAESRADAWLPNEIRVKREDELMIRQDGLDSSRASVFVCRYVGNLGHVDAQIHFLGEDSVMMCTVPAWPYGWGNLQLKIVDVEHNMVYRSQSSGADSVSLRYVATVESFTFSPMTASGLVAQIRGLRGGFQKRALRCELVSCESFSLLGSSIATFPINDFLECKIEWRLPPSRYASTNMRGDNAKGVPERCLVDVPVSGLIRLVDASSKSDVVAPHLELGCTIGSQKHARWRWLSEAEGPADGRTPVLAYVTSLPAGSRVFLEFYLEGLTFESPPVIVEDGNGPVLFSLPNIWREAAEMDVKMFSVPRLQIRYADSCGVATFKFISGWTKLDVSKGHAGGGTAILVSGYGFDTSKHEYACEFSTSDLGIPVALTKAIVIDHRKLKCMTPNWNEKKPQCSLSILQGHQRLPCTGCKNVRSGIFKFLPSWRALSSNPEQVNFPLRGGESIYVQGHALPENDLMCRFKSGETVEENNAKVLSPSLMFCSAPQWGHIFYLNENSALSGHDCTEFNMVLMHGPLVVPFVGHVVHTLVSCPWVESVTPQRIPVGSTFVMQVAAHGLNLSQSYTCSVETTELSGRNAVRMSSEPTYPINSNSLDCTMPPWKTKAPFAKIEILRDLKILRSSQDLILSVSAEPEVKMYKNLYTGGDNPNQGLTSEVSIAAEWGALDVVFDTFSKRATVTIMGVGFKSGRPHLYMCEFNDVSGDIQQCFPEVIGSKLMVCEYIVRTPHSGEERKVIVNVEENGKLLTFSGGPSDKSFTLRNLVELDHTPADNASSESSEKYFPDFKWKSSEIYECLEDSGWHSVAAFAGDFACSSGRLQCGEPHFTISENQYGISKQAFVENGAPQIDNIGCLTFGLIPNFYGSASFNVTLSFSEIPSRSKPKSFSVVVVPVNDPPTFSLSLTTIHVFEDDYTDASFFLRGFILGLFVEPFSQPKLQQQVSFLVLPINKQQKDTFELFVSAPSVSSEGTLSFQTQADQNGIQEFSVQAVDNGGVTLGGCDASDVKYFTVHVSPRDDVPSFETQEAWLKITVREDQFSKEMYVSESVILHLSLGAENEDLGISFFVSEVDTTNPALFCSLPTLDSKGRLRFRTGKDQSGSSVFGVSLQDGSHVSPIRNISIHVLETNDAPSFDMPSILTVWEDEPITRWHGFAYNIRSGPRDPVQDLSFHLEFIDGSSQLFHTNPRLSNDGTLSFRLKENDNGAVTFKVTLKDSGGVDGGGVDISIEHSLVIQVLAVNDSPSFYLQTAAFLVLEDSQDTEFPNVVSNIRAGPSAKDEMMQFLTFIVTNVTLAHIFQSLPSVSVDGKLRFKLSLDQNGVSTALLSLVDNACENPLTCNGVSDAKTLTVNVVPVNDAPGFVLQSSVIHLDHDHLGFSQEAFFTKISSGGGMDEKDQRLLFLVQPAASDASAFLDWRLPAVSNCSTQDGDHVCGFGFEMDKYWSGTIQCVIVLLDDGGNSNGGWDRSSVVVVEIRVKSSSRIEQSVVRLVRLMPMLNLSSSSADMLTSFGSSKNIETVDGDIPSKPFLVGSMRSLLAHQTVNESSPYFSLNFSSVCQQGYRNLILPDLDSSQSLKQLSVIAMSNSSTRCAQSQDKDTEAYMLVLKQGELFAAHNFISDISNGEEAGGQDVSFRAKPLQNDDFTVLQLVNINCEDESNCRAGKAALRMRAASKNYGYELISIIMNTTDGRSYSRSVQVLVMPADLKPSFRMAVERPCMLGRCERYTGTSLGTCSAPAYPYNAAVQLSSAACGLYKGAACIMGNPSNKLTHVLSDCSIQSDSLCNAPLTIWLDEGCIGRYQWTNLNFEGHDKIVRKVPVAEMCCNPELSGKGTTFELEHFIFSTAGDLWEDSSQEITYNITQVSSRSVATSMHLSADGTLKFHVVPDIYGSSEFKIEIRDSSGQTESKNFVINILKRNQGPHLRVHKEYRAFHSNEPQIIRNAVYNINSGRAFNFMRLSSVPRDDDAFKDCHYQPHPDNEESHQNIVSAIVSVDRPNLFDLGTGGFVRLVLNGSCANLEYKTSQFSFGTTHMALTLTDSEGTQRTNIVIFNLVPVNSAPTFNMQERIVVSLDEHCASAMTAQRVGERRVQDGGDLGCPFSFPKFASDIRAGEFQGEICTNCPDSPLCADPESCIHQQLSFFLDDVSEPALFNSLPSLDLNGTLRFSLQPGASGMVRVVFRLLDDVSLWNDGGQNPQNTSVSSFDSVDTDASGCISFTEFNDYCTNTHCDVDEFQPIYSASSQDFYCVREISPADIRAYEYASLPGAFPGKFLAGIRWNEIYSACSNNNTLPCGPAATPGFFGSNSSKAREFFIEVSKKNDAPSFILPRDVECLSPYTDFKNPGDCSCPSLADSFVESRLCHVIGEDSLNASGVLPIVKVLESSGPQDIRNFMPGIGVSDAVHALATLFDFDNRTGNLTFDASAIRKDPILGAPGLDMATVFALSPDQKNVYTAEFASGTMSVLNHTEGDTKMRFMDRHGHGEKRVRFEHHQLFITNNPCKVFIWDGDDKKYLAVANGCADVGQSKEFLDMDSEGDVMGLTQADYKRGSLWKHTVGFWQMSPTFFTGRVTRPKKYDTITPCFEMYDTDVSPAMVLDSSGNLPPGVMHGSSIEQFYTCKQNSWSDVPIGRQPSLHTFAATDGTNEAIQFDGKNLQGLWVTNDLDSILGMLPTKSVSIELWFTISDFGPISTVPTFSGLISAAHNKYGWLLRYRSISCVGDCNDMNMNLNIEFSFYVNTSNPKLQDNAQTVTCNKFLDGPRKDQAVSCRKHNWNHIVVTYDGQSALVYYNGNKIGMLSVCTDEICAIKYPVCDFDPTPKPPAAPQGFCKNKELGGTTPGTFVIGAIDTQAQIGYHSGMIKSARIYNTTLSHDQIAIIYDVGRASGLTNVSVNYWVKVPTDTESIPSPGNKNNTRFVSVESNTTDFNSDVQENITVMGRFNVSLQYRVRWSIPGYYADSDVCVVQNARSLDPDPYGRETCSALVNVKDSTTVCSSASFCCDTATKNQLLCRRPKWYMGYKAAVVTVVEGGNSASFQECQRVCGLLAKDVFRSCPPPCDAKTEQERYTEKESLCVQQCLANKSWANEPRILWQRTCLSSDCGYLTFQQVVKENPLPSSKAVALWWLAGKVGDLTIFLACANNNKINVGCTTLDQAVSGGKFNVISPDKIRFLNNHGSRAHFVWRVPSYYSSFREVFDEIFDFKDVYNLDFALGASSFKIFTSAKDKQYIAVANFWDGLSSQTLSCLAEFDPGAQKISIVQTLPTRSARAWEHFQLSVNEETVHDYVALASYSGMSSIFRFDPDSQPITSLSLVTPGQGYVPGVVKIEGSEGFGFRALFDAQGVTIADGQQSNLAIRSARGAVYCTEPFKCFDIVSKGRNYRGLPFTSLTQVQLAGLDPNCTQLCNPYTMDSNCTRSLPAKCFQNIVVGNVSLFYTEGCSREDSDCENVYMSKSITRVHLAPVTVLPGKNVQVSLIKIGHTNNCFRNGILKDGDGHRPNSDKVTMAYEVNSLGQMVDVYFPYAGGHGRNYETLPALVTSDHLCRCGTTVTEIEILDPGEEYSSGYLDISGPGAEFSATYEVQGNVSQAIILAGGGGFSAMPKVTVEVDPTYESGGMGVSAVALLGIKGIVLARTGSPYSSPPLVVIDPPTAKNGVPAAARAVLMQRANGSNVSFIEKIEVIDPGLGYTSVPTITILDDLFETRRQVNVNGTISKCPVRIGNVTSPECRNLAVVDALAIPFMEVKAVMPNHFFNIDRLSWAHRTAPALNIVRAQRNTWFGSSQNSKYEMPLSVDRTRVVGMTMNIEMQHSDFLLADSNVSRTMRFLCDDCVFEPWRTSKNKSSSDDSTMRYLATDKLYKDLNLFAQMNASIITSISANPTRASVIFELFEPVCLDVCLKLSECVGVDIGKDLENQGQCWIHVKKSEDPDGLWRNDTAPISRMGPNSKGCLSNATWTDGFGRNCSTLINQRVCPVNSTWINGSLTIWINGSLTVLNPGKLQNMLQMLQSQRRNNTAWETSELLGYKISPFMNFTGDVLKDTACNRTNCSGFITGYDACCECGKNGPRFRAYLKQQTTITMQVNSAVDLLCRPAKSAGLLSDVDQCNFPFKRFSIWTNASQTKPDQRCCFDPSSQAVYVSIVQKPSALNIAPSVTWSMQLQEVKFDDWINWTNVTVNRTNVTVNSTNISSKLVGTFVRNQSIILKGAGIPIDKIGTKGQIVYASISSSRDFSFKSAEISAMPMLAASRPIVTGKIVRIKHSSRGTNYTNSDKVLIHPKERADFHEESGGDRYTFRNAIIRHAIGFSGKVPGVFDGSNIDAMCSTAEDTNGLCSRDAPYGEGFGPCIGMTRASDAEILASTATIDLYHSTQEAVEGATDVLFLNIDGDRYLVYSSYFNLTEFRRLVAVAPSTGLLSSEYPPYAVQAAFKTKSPLFRVEMGKDGQAELYLVQQFDTNAAHDVMSYVFDGIHYLIFANQRGPVSPVFSWSKPNKEFVLVQQLPTSGARSVSVFEKVLQGEKVLFGLLGQHGRAQQCLLDDQLRDSPLCGDEANRALYEPEDMAGIRGFGAARTDQFEQGYALMLRWNGSMWQDVPNPKTLPNDLSGGQAFSAPNASIFEPFATQNNQFALLMTSLAPNICKDSNETYCEQVGKNGSCVFDSNGDLTHNYLCDVCPKTCGTCKICNDQYEDMKMGICQDNQNIKSLNLVPPPLPPIDRMPMQKIECN